MLRQVTTGAAAAALLALAVGVCQPGPARAQEAAGMAGSGPNRICNTLIDSRNQPVLSSGGGTLTDMPTPKTQAVLITSTYDCPEAMPVAQVEPAAPPPLPGQAVVYFAFDKATLTPEAEQTLNGLVADVKGRQLGGVTVGGHTDTAGPAEYNMKLSQRRANAVAGYLTKEGIPAEIITTEAFGETDLAVPTPDNTPKQANRRATVDVKQ
jgi:outer membrane protein OmpA-like peptidoglycan-associated protein